MIYKNIKNYRERLVECTSTLLTSLRAFNFQEQRDRNIIFIVLNYIYVGTILSLIVKGQKISVIRIAPGIDTRNVLN